MISLNYWQIKRLDEHCTAMGRRLFTIGAKKPSSLAWFCKLSSNFLCKSNARLFIKFFKLSKNYRAGLRGTVNSRFKKEKWTFLNREFTVLGFVLHIFICELNKKYSKKISDSTVPLIFISARWNRRLGLTRVPPWKSRLPSFIC